MSRVELPPLPPGVAAFTPTQRDHIALQALMRDYGIACARAAVEAAKGAASTTPSAFHSARLAAAFDVGVDHAVQRIRALSVGSEGE